MSTCLLLEENKCFPFSSVFLMKNVLQAQTISEIHPNVANVFSSCDSPLHEGYVVCVETVK